MMKAKFVLPFILSFVAVTSFAQSKTDTVKVWGNCDMCKSKIEKAAKQAGAASANWSSETYLLVLNYDAATTSALDIQKSVAATGYDTQDVKADDAAYKKLPGCCQYKRKSQEGTEVSHN